MAQISRCGSWLLLSVQDKFATLNVDGGANCQGVVQSLGCIASKAKPNEAAPESSADGELAAKETKTKADPTGDTSLPRSVVASAVSPNGVHVAACDSKKTLSIWKKAAAAADDEKAAYELVATHNLNTRSDHLTFTPDISAVLVADKSGDVIKVPLDGDGQAVTASSAANEGEEEEDQLLLLGHLSMLLGIEVSRCGRFVLTADRDEKIRVSHFPNAYNIHGFCLGHTEFVSAIKIHPENGDVIVSGSGDGSVRTWKFVEGAEIDRKVCGEDAGVKLTPVTENGEPKDDGDKNAGNGTSQDSKLRRAQVPGVKALKCHKQKVVVHIENFQGLLMYDCSPDGRLAYQGKTELDHPVIDFEFVGDDDLCVLLADEANPVIVLDGSTGSKKEKTESSLLEFVRSFFSGASEALKAAAKCQSLDGYYKRWFDNVNAYQENKEKRINEKRTANNESSNGNDAKKVCSRQSDS